MPTIHANDAPTFDAGGATITGLAAPSRGATDIAAWRVEFAADHTSPTHALTREEVFVVLRGELTVAFADREERVAAGGAVIVPPHEPFSLVAHGAPAEAICALPVGGEAIIGEDRFTPPWAA